MVTLDKASNLAGKINSRSNFFGGSKTVIPFFQPKLTINQPNDIYEQEADAMAEKVMRMPTQFIQRKCAACQDKEEKNVQLKPATVIQKQDEEAPADSAPVASPAIDFKLPLPSLLQPSTQPDYLAMRQPFFQRNIFHLWDAGSALQVWNYNFDFFRRFGLSPDLSASASNFTAPFFIHSQLKAGNSTWWEITDRDMGTTSFAAALPILDFNADFSPAAPSWFRTIFGGGNTPVQRKCDHCEEEESEVQRKNASGQERAADGFENYVSGLNGNGEQLPADVRSFYEPRFGYDFSNVKIHNDSAAAASAKSVNALAYTTGTNIVFGDGQYGPGNDGGKRLLGHELTHVVQQGNSDNTIQTDLAVDLPNPTAEAPVLTAEQIEDAIRFNTRRFNLRDEWEVSLVRDVLGLDELPAIVDEDLINAIASYQAENNINADGKIGAVTASRLSRELFNEGQNLPSAERREILRSSRRMGTRALRIRVNQPATKLDDLGSANYGVMWEIGDREANGFVIQHVRITGNIQDCAGNAVAMNGFVGNNDYWEVWRVVNGRVRCGTLSVPCSGSDDTFTTVSQNAGTRGTVTERGQVSYYPDYLLNADWISGITHPAGDLPHRATRPPFWNESETMRHEMVITYDDCSTPAVLANVTSTP